ncbi:MAG: hypothetical protein UW46_C0001G0120 [Candidatus Yanofskybacteria bacterium GW2011_GWF1_44_227]|uniref:Uncharacterized protein n=1 Tax=Candidatus Yanofskybacteria bacterium GW2011_GWE2_40_11 TaxID=1619033 RepID=A0A0G0QUW5_9BACT|nr:MAG: hypothetical protein UT69_C0013G0049 [Candidatus Yanofskybacteria bacterium GW2011_GWE1_40_10]KKR41146.1 MAG: hypothetical protein UT75_C0001G0050 [Candidatus Yanofskybacteria bacterium GW2011_GWE2_40_11]KKT15857.1 MAG: hypothetical protein UV97_C0001G0030 [Candidatus Yanofskybacteria bacterium GW2011_GWF2_43_596]KKT53630.1 MAG: hypothetical protein UW46_C0001G0120 [Candidatus Yanofskybacteria bacterium GW2011_GWF1_44_227]HBX58497.1 hypothetical protein [Candidatus Yanofskybacteria bact
MSEQKIRKRRWAHYSNICKFCNGHNFLLNTSRLVLEQCPHCDGTGYGDQEPPDDGTPGSSNAA